MLLMIDNYDSFTYNLVQYLGQLDCEVEVHRNDKISVEDVNGKNPAHVMISPGPGTPDDAGVSMDVIRDLAGKVPLLGVCLGHQSIGQVFGGSIVSASEIMHGKLSMVHHNGSGVFANLPSPFRCTRYHSLVIDKQTLPGCLEVTAWTETESGEMAEIMGVRHRELCIEGVQFHPESIMSEHGHNMLRNFLDMEVAA
ncbi:MAG: aminodeoxychorismate/anthranilate synthase component II [Pseudomonadota bacterium]